MVVGERMRKVAQRESMKIMGVSAFMRCPWDESGEEEYDEMEE